MGYEWMPKLRWDNPGFRSPILLISNADVWDSDPSFTSLQSGVLLASLVKLLPVLQLSINKRNYGNGKMETVILLSGKNSDCTIIKRVGRG